MLKANRPAVDALTLLRLSGCADSFSSAPIHGVVAALYKFDAISSQWVQKLRRQKSLPMPNSVA
jgi:hypothetical protein